MSHLGAKEKENRNTENEFSLSSVTGFLRQFTSILKIVNHQSTQNRVHFPSTSTKKDSNHLHYITAWGKFF